MNSKQETTEYFSTKLCGMVATTCSKSFSIFGAFGLSRWWQQLSLERVNAELPWIYGWDSHQIVWLKYLCILTFFPFLKILFSFFILIPAWNFKRKMILSESYSCQRCSYHCYPLKWATAAGLTFKTTKSVAPGCQGSWMYTRILCLSSSDWRSLVCTVSRSA